MKLLCTILLICASGLAEEIIIDWSTVKPITEYPEFWGYQPNLTPHDDSESVSKFIIGGNNAALHQFPFHTGLVSEMSFGSALCSGSLISRSSVLTSASCLIGAANTIVFLGARNMRDNSERYQARFRVQSSAFMIHPGHLRNGRTLNNDVGIIRLPHSIAFFTPAVNVVQMPTPADLNNVFSNTNCIMMGFGRASTNTRDNTYVNRYVRLSTVNNNSCRHNNLPVNVQDEHICTSSNQGRSLCSGSLGAPLVIERNGGFVQIGIASFYPNNCASLSSGYTRVVHRQAFDWIIANA